MIKKIQEDFVVNNKSSPIKQYYITSIIYPLDYPLKCSSGISKHSYKNTSSHFRLKKTIR